jgi:hypothetical protein
MVSMLIARGTTCYPQTHRRGPDQMEASFVRGIMDHEGVRSCPGVEDTIATRPL